MYEKRKFISILTVSLLLTMILSFKLIIVKNKFVSYKHEEVLSGTKVKNTVRGESYGYSDILECLKKSGDLQIQSISMVENEKCNVEVNYRGDINLLYNVLCELNESKNFLGINSININKDAKITNMSINFKKNK